MYNRTCKVFQLSWKYNRHLKNPWLAKRNTDFNVVINLFWVKLLKSVILCQLANCTWLQHFTHIYKYKHTAENEFILTLSRGQWKTLNDPVLQNLLYWGKLHIHITIFAFVYTYEYVSKEKYFSILPSQSCLITTSNLFLVSANRYNLHSH